MKKNLILRGAGVALITFGLYGMFKKSKKSASLTGGAIVPNDIPGTVPSYLEHLVEIGGEDMLKVIAMDPAWAELVQRSSEFLVLCKEEFYIFLKAVAEVIAFVIALNLKNKKPSFGTPRVFRTKLHGVIEGVRLMRAAVEEKCFSALNDFDEVASDIQKMHDDAAYNMLLDAGV